MIFVLLLSAGICLAQTQFVRAVGGTDRDYGYSIVGTSDGGFAVAGRTYSFGAGASDLSLVKFASTGAVEWSRAVGGTNDDDGWSVIGTSDGGFAVAGVTGSFGAGERDFFLVKFASTGAVELAKSVGGTSNDYCRSAVQAADGGYAVAGYTGSFGAGSYDLFLVKFTSTGVVEWSRAVGGTGYDYGYSVVATSDGGFAVAGVTGSFGAGSDDLFLVKFTSTGTFEWTRAVGGTSNDYGWSVVATSDGGFAVAGATYSFGAGSYDLFIVKFTSTGAVEWSRAVGGTEFDYGYSLVAISDGGFAVAGVTGSFGTGGDLLLVKFTSTGAVEWSRAVGGTDYDQSNSVVGTSDGGFAVAGYTDSFGAGNSDLFLVKFDASGNTCIGEAVSPTVTITSPDVASPSPSLASPSPMVTTVTPTVTDFSPTLTEICTGLDIAETQTCPKSFRITVKPNPFNSAVTISVGAIHELPLRIEIFDINGRMVADIFADNTVGSRHASTAGDAGVAPTNSEYIWQPEKSVGSGVYLVRCTGLDLNEIKRIVYLK